MKNSLDITIYPNVDVKVTENTIEFATNVRLLRHGEFYILSVMDTHEMATDQTNVVLGAIYLTNRFHNFVYIKSLLSDLSVLIKDKNQFNEIETLKLKNILNGQ